MAAVLAEPAVGVRYDKFGDEIPHPDDIPTWDGEPMESLWHSKQIAFLLELVEFNWQGRPFYAGSDNCIYYSVRQIRNRDFLCPDFYVFVGVDHGSIRPYWAAWDQNGKFPDFILEMNSPTTAERDLTTKKDVYEREFKTPDYACFDDDEDVLRAWKLVGGQYVRNRSKGDRIWLASLNLWLGRWEGTYQGYSRNWLRFFDAGGRMLPTEAERKDEQLRAETARAKAETAKAKAETARADGAEAELRKLKAELDRLKSGGTQG